MYKPFIFKPYDKVNAMYKFMSLVQYKAIIGQ